MKRLLDVDHWLVFILLAVTVNQMGHYLGGFAPAGMGWIGYCQAVAIDAAIWRSAYWFRRYGGRKQRAWSLVGVLVFSLVSAWYNSGYYREHTGAVQAALMGAVLPLGVALMSYLSGQKDESRFGVRPEASSERQSQLPKVSAQKPQTWSHFLKSYPNMLEMTGRQIAAIAGVSERTGNNWKRAAVAETRKER